MRNITDITIRIAALLPDPSTIADPIVSFNIGALKAEIGSVQRRSLYVAPEDGTAWRDLTDLLNRYLPTPTSTSGYTWAWAISQLMRGITA
jgi:hypothetical protein